MPIKDGTGTNTSIYCKDKALSAQAVIVSIPDGC